MLSLFGSELFRYRLGRVFSRRINSRHLLCAGEGGTGLFDSRLDGCCRAVLGFYILLFMRQRGYRQDYIGARSGIQGVT